MWFGNLVSVLGSILGKRTNKEINNNLNKPETKKKKQGKNKNIEKEVIKCTVLDFLSAFVDQDQTKRRVDDLTDTEINNLTEKQPDLKSWIESIAKTPIPQLWQTHLEHCKVKTAFIYMINALGITLGNNLIPLFEHSKGVNIEQLLHDYDSGKIDFNSFILEIGKEMKIKNSDECLWKQAISPFIRQTIGKATEQELTRNMFAPLFNSIGNFKGCEGNANCSIKPYISYGSIAQNFRAAIPDFHPDDFIVVDYGGTSCMRLIREDSSDQYNFHTDHKDFINLVLEMRLALTKTVRNLIRDEIEDWHNLITVLGVTTDSKNSYAYCMSCSIEQNLTGKISLHYTLDYLGTFSHFKRDDRIQLMSKLIIALSTPKIELVAQYLQTRLISSSKKQTDLPKCFRMSFPVPRNIFVTYEENSQYCYVAKGKIIKKALLLDETPIYVKSNLRSTNEHYIASTLPFATLYIITNDPQYCISLAGIPLSDCFTTNGKNLPDANSVFNFTLDLIVQLYALEQTNFIHNDVKPENMVKYDEHWFLIDYEISLIFDPQKDTYRYRAPERRIDNLVSPKSDVYSLGLVILEIGKRRNSWESKDEKEIFQKCDKLAVIDITMLKLLKSMLKNDSKQRSSPLDLVNLLKLDEAIQPKLKETIRYFKERERFWHLVKTKDTEIVRALDFIQIDN